MRSSGPKQVEDVKRYTLQARQAIYIRMAKNLEIAAVAYISCGQDYPSGPSHPTLPYDSTVRLLRHMWMYMHACICTYKQEGGVDLIPRPLMMSHLNGESFIKAFIRFGILPMRDATATINFNAQTRFPKPCLG